MEVGRANVKDGGLGADLLHKGPGLCSVEVGVFLEEAVGDCE
jgi:hypothetical protein